MDKWEYKVVRTYGGVVMLTNGQEVGKIVNNQPVGQMLYEYLNELGEEGWEVVSLHQPHSSNKVWVTIKRPLTTSTRRLRSRPEQQW